MFLSRACSKYLHRGVSSVCLVRSFHASSPKLLQAQAVVYHSYGEPSKVLKLETQTIPDSPAADEVLVEMLSSTITPGDIQIIKGELSGGVSSKLPAVAGSSGIGRAVSVGSNVTSIKQGDWVLPANLNHGTWRTHFMAKEEDLLVSQKFFKAEYASMLGAGPLVAYLLLNNYAKLEPGDVVIQNASNGLVGSCIYQLSAILGLKTINIIRHRYETYGLFQRIKQLGGYVVVDDEYAQTYKFRRLISDLPAPKLALNSVGGPSATEMARTLATGGKLVTYGASSGKPVEVSTDILVEKELSLEGFWLNDWVKNTSREEKQKVVDAVSELFQNQKIKLFGKNFKLEDFGPALHEFQNNDVRNASVLFKLQSVDKVKPLYPFFFDLPKAQH